MATQNRLSVEEDEMDLNGENLILIYENSKLKLVHDVKEFLKFVYSSCT